MNVSCDIDSQHALECGVKPITDHNFVAIAWIISTICHMSHTWHLI